MNQTISSSTGLRSYIYIDSQAILQKNEELIFTGLKFYNSSKKVHVKGLIGCGRWSQVYSVYNSDDWVVKVVPINRYMLNSKEITWEQVVELKNEEIANGSPETDICGCNLVTQTEFEKERNVSIQMSDLQIGPSLKGHAIVALNCTGESFVTNVGCLLMERLQYTLGEYAKLLHERRKNSYKEWQKVQEYLSAQMIKSFKAGLVHRDLHSENIMVNIEANTLQVQKLRLIDFGLMETPEAWISRKMYSVAREIAEEMKLDLHTVC